MELNNRQIIVIRVQNKAGVLNKILSLCRRRRFSLLSVNAGATEEKNIYQITLVFPAFQADKISQVVNQINRIIEVISVEASEEDEIIDRELVLLVCKDLSKKKWLLKNKQGCDIRMVSQKKNKVVWQISGEGESVNNLLNRLDNKSMKYVRTGLVAIKI